MACPEFVTFYTGAKMPILGYGTWQAKDDELEEAVEHALCAGYRHFDTAAVYDNEHVIGRKLHSWISTGNLTREELFVVTKLPPAGMRAESVEKFLKRSLEKLQLDYVDLYLVHVPFGFKEAGDDMHPMDADGNMLFDHSTDHVAIWKAMEAQVDAGRAKAIGLSNFNQRQIQRVLDNARIKPVNLQVEVHVYFQQRPLVDFCQKNGITVCAYSPLGSPGSKTLFAHFGHKVELPNLISNPTVVEIAKKHNVKPGQILLKHIIQRGIATIPKSTSEQRIIDNISLWTFTLDSDDIAKLDALDQGKAGRILDMMFFKGCDKHPEYPFNE